MMVTSLDVYDGCSLMCYMMVTSLDVYNVTSLDVYDGNKSCYMCYWIRLGLSSIVKE